MKNFRSYWKFLLAANHCRMLIIREVKHQPRFLQHALLIWLTTFLKCILKTISILYDSTHKLCQPNSTAGYIIVTFMKPASAVHDGLAFSKAYLRVLQLAFQIYALPSS